MKILYIGPDSGTCRQRRRALERLGHDVFATSPLAELPLANRLQAWSFKTGGLGLETLVGLTIRASVGERSFDLALVDGGELIGPGLVQALKRRARAVVLINLDHPFSRRDGLRWRLLRRALARYDLFVTPRKPTADAARAAGVRRVLQVDFAADEIAHVPILLNDEDKRRYAGDVVFVGTWMPERGAFLKHLIDRGVPLRIYGWRWSKAPEYATLAPYVTEGWVEGEAYAKAIQGAKIAIGLLSKGNEDLHTTRSLEIPAMGALLCAERTSDHLRMYREGAEAVFWRDADDCADQCLALLADPGRIKAIAAAGRRRVIANRAFNEPLMAKVIDAALATNSASG